MSEMDRRAQRGEPSYVWRAGQEHRFRLLSEAAGDRIHGRVLDNGCGVGQYLLHLSREAGFACGLEFDAEYARQAAQRTSNVVRGAGEALPFPAGCFDLILSHEVLEHVEDDHAAAVEIVRLLRPPDQAKGRDGGRLILFAPNRGYPFETHGVYWRGSYHFGNIPLVNYMPAGVRDRLAPHVRAYTRSQLLRLFDGLPAEVVSETIIFGAYDNIIARWPRLGRALRGVTHALETTPLRALGLSHFVVVERR